MPLKKQSYNDDVIPIYYEAVLYRRGEYWQIRMWLANETYIDSFDFKPLASPTLTWLKLQ